MTKYFQVGHFEWNQYSALQAIRDGNMNSVNEFITEGRLVVLSSLSHSSLESCNNIYKGLSQLQALQVNNSRIFNAIDQS